MKTSTLNDAQKKMWKNILLLSEEGAENDRDRAKHQVIQ